MMSAPALTQTTNMGLATQPASAEQQEASPQVAAPVGLELLHLHRILRRIHNLQQHLLQKFIK